MKIGDKIRFIRDKERNFTQAYVADQLGITTKAYSNIENNISDPSYSKLLKIAEILECNITYLINYEQNRSNYNNRLPNNIDQGILNYQNNAEFEIINKIYEDIKKLHAEIMIRANQIKG